MCDWWTKIEPQVKYMMEDLNFRGIYSDDVMDVLMQENWIMHEYINTHKFHYESVEFTLKGLCDMFELLTGSYIGFNVALLYRLKEVVGRREYERQEVIT